MRRYPAIVVCAVAATLGVTMGNLIVPSLDQALGISPTDLSPQVVATGGTSSPTPKDTGRPQEQHGSSSDDTRDNTAPDVPDDTGRTETDHDTSPDDSHRPPNPTSPTDDSHGSGSGTDDNDRARNTTPDDEQSEPESTDEPEQPADEPATDGSPSESETTPSEPTIPEQPSDTGEPTPSPTPSDTPTADPSESPDEDEGVCVDVDLTPLELALCLLGKDGGESGATPQTPQPTPSPTR